MVPSRLTQQQSSSSSGIFFQGDSHLSSSFANSSNSIPGANRPNPTTTTNNNNSSSVGASSLVTDANSSGGPHLQRSASISNNNNAAESSSYLCLPASPMSFSSNNASVDGSSSVVQQHDPNPNPAGPAGASSATSALPGPRMMYLPEQMQMQMQKKARVEMVKQEDIVQQQMLQQILQRQEGGMQFQGARTNPQLQVLLQQQQQRLRQQQHQHQQQILQSMPQLQRAHIQQQHHHQQQQQMQLRQQQQQQQGMQQLVPAPAPVKRPIDGGVCARRLMQYLYHQRQRPTDNAIAYWRKFVAEYYSPRAKKRWCLSLYENVGNHALGVFPQASMDAWQCELCGSKSGKGFEATSEVLPRLNEIKFGSGVIDELLFLDMPCERRYPNGIMTLEYSKAVQESVYEQLRVVREGQLRIIFSQDLKILSWEFCARRHEELLPRRVVAPQVSNLLQVAQKCQSTITESGSDGVSQQDMQTNSNLVISARRQLTKSMESQSLNDLGFSKRYVRCLQISEVVNSMKDLIDFCREHKAGPIDGLKNYPRHNSAAAKLQMQQKIQEMEQLANARGISTDPNTINKLMALNPAMNNQMPNNSNIHNNINNSHLVANRGGALSGPAQAALSLTNFQNHLHLRQNSMNSNPNSSSQQQQQQEASSSFNNSNQSPSLSGYSSPQPYNRSMSANSSMMQQNHAQGGSQALQQQMIQQLLQEISSSNSAAAAGGGGGGGMQQQSLSGIVARNGMSFGGGGGGVPPPSRSNSFKAASNSDSSAAAASGGGGGGNNGYHQRVPPDLGQNLHLQEELAKDIAQEFSDNGFFSGDLDDGAGFFQNGRRE